jgi:RimJ/RimL family protein N-acetyltransferase
MPSIPLLAQPLSDGFVALRFTVARDIPEMLIAYQDDPTLHVRMSRERPPSGAELGAELERAERERAAGRRASLTIVEPPADDCGGVISVHTIDWEQSRAELGIWVEPARRTRGLARRALQLVAPWLFEACGLDRLELLTDPDNEAMLRAARGAGFVYEGLLRAYRRGRHGRRDMVMLSLLRGEHEARSNFAGVSREQAG